MNIGSFKKISLLLAKLPSGAYAALYLLCIPTFAAVYHFLIPTHFYHSTVQYETSISKDAGVLAIQIQSAINQEVKSGGNPSVITLQGRKYKIKTLAVSSLVLYEDKMSFKVYLDSITTHESGIELGNTKRFDCHILNPGGVRLMEKGRGVSVTREDGSVVSVKLPMDTAFHILKCDLDETSIKMTELFPTPQIRDNVVLLPLNKEAHNNLISLMDWSQGFPSGTSRGYARMFYFSSVTITTLGYGDILPITEISRYLVALESILGIVLIGLFLNSLSRESKT